MNLVAFSEVPPAVQIHAIAAGCALITGLSLLVLPRGRKAHRTLGITTAVLLFITALSAAFIFQLNHGWPSFIHILVPVTFIGLFGLSMSVAKKNWKQHKAAARRLIFGALVIPAAIAFFPGRLLNIVAFG